ncbi:hypothetical protein LRE75_29450 [Streptomyces sp. 372A]
MNTDLETAIAALHVGDHVRATGADTRGHDVTRVGTLLAEPKAVTAQRNGIKTIAWRLFVGPAGTDPSVRSTWTTLFYDSGTVALAEEPSPDAWTNASFGSVPGVRIGTPNLTFRYGGKGGKRSVKPGFDVTVFVTYTSDGKYWLRDVATGDFVEECTYARKIWWAPASKVEESQGSEEIPPEPEPEPEPERAGARPRRRGMGGKDLPLIGLAGAAGAGKDTAAQILLDVGWQRRAFADRLREFLVALDPLVDAVDEPYLVSLSDEVKRVGWAKMKNYSATLRGLYQRAGTDAGRGVLGEDVWVDSLFRDYESWHRPTVITDVRFPNEARAIRERGGLVVQIVRPERQLIPEAGHISETALAGYDFDAVLINTGGPQRVREQLQTYVTRMGYLNHLP